ncbi:MAG TPA: hypothetical protein VEC99_02035 [Clostridia bacterium]|nr:hypothetical protein [Clostridia bacterium]
MRLSILTKTATLLGAAVMLLSPTANATITIDYPMYLSSPHIVGYAEGLNGDNAGSDASIIAQNLLSMVGLNQTATINTRNYFTSTILDYSGTIQGLGTKTDLPPNPPGTTIHLPSGYQFAIAKYDGKDAGWVMFHLGGQDANIPTVSHSFWGDPTKEDQYKISNYTLFNPIPEPTTVIAGALLLIPFGVSTLRHFRKKA